jgi:DnaJ family protein B protein 12
MNEVLISDIGGGGMFDAGPGFVFNLGGGPGVRVHQFGGARPRRRPRDPNTPEEPATPRSILMSLLPLIVIFVLPLLTSLFSGSSSGISGPSMRFDGAVPPHTQHRMTPRLKVDYYINPADVEQYTPHKLSQLDSLAESNYVQQLDVGCEHEKEVRQRMIQDAQGWFLPDQVKLNKARNMVMKDCRKLEELGYQRRTGY